MLELVEGRNDPHIFKAVFMAGAPGSGKTTISSQLFEGTGLKTVNVDQFHSLYSKLRKKIPDNYYLRFWKTTVHQRNLFSNGRLGMVIDSTSRNLETTLEQKIMLEEMGYDTAMIFVNCSLQTALSRIAAREERTGRKVDTEYAKQAWREVQGNVGHLQSEFGGKFLVIDNSNSNQSDLRFAHQWVRNFINSPIKNPVAREWLQNMAKRNVDKSPSN